MPKPADTFQAQFHLRWNHLNDPHVRTLAWLLDAPDLLDPHAPPWRGRVASLGPVDEKTAAWLAELDRAPDGLHAYLGLPPFTRLGRYSEKLMAFYLQHQGVLFAHGVQVRSGKNDTIGEFDFLLRRGDALIHWEFATKLYLLEPSGYKAHADYFIGPNLADTLGVKIRKIMDRQLSLSQHPAAQSHLPQPVTAAQALVKGWLFYHGQAPVALLPQGISGAHCCGFWYALEELDQLPPERYIVLPRLGWLAPVKTRQQVLDKAALKEQLSATLQEGAPPVMVAALAPSKDGMVETGRGFIVPDDWRRRAEVRVSNL